MKKAVLFVGMLALDAAFGAVATVEVQSFDVTDDVPHVVTATYTLSADAIVTADVLTNGVSVGAAITTIGGDVNRRVKATGENEVRTIVWTPDASFGGQTLSGANVKVEVTAWDDSTPPDYMAFDLLEGTNISYYASEAAVPGGVHDIRYMREKVLMRMIPAKDVTWLMGTELAYSNRVGGASGSSWYFNASRAHKVKLTRNFYIGVYQLTAAQYWAFQGTVSSSSYFLSSSYVPRATGVSSATPFNYDFLRGTGDDWPTFDEDGNFDIETSHKVAAGSFIQKMRALTGFAYLDLPTEAQWEFAARAGVEGLLPGGETNLSAANVGKYGCFSGSAAPVGSYLPNKWGLYDVIGNNVELCLDRWLDWRTLTDEERNTVSIDPVGARTETNHHAFRGAPINQSAEYNYLSRRENMLRNDNGTAYKTVRLAVTLY